MLFCHPLKMNHPIYILKMKFTILHTHAEHLVLNIFILEGQILLANHHRLDLKN